MLSEVEEKEKIANTKSMDKIEGYDPEDMIEMATSGGIRQVSKQRACFCFGYVGILRLRCIITKLSHRRQRYTCSYMTGIYMTCLMSFIKFLNFSMVLVLLVCNFM